MKLAPGYQSLLSNPTSNKSKLLLQKFICNLNEYRTWLKYFGKTDEFGKELLNLSYLLNQEPILTFHFEKSIGEVSPYSKQIFFDKTEKELCACVVKHTSLYNQIRMSLRRDNKITLYDEGRTWWSYFTTLGEWPFDLWFEIFPLWLKKIVLWLISVVFGIIVQISCFLLTWFYFSYLGRLINPNLHIKSDTTLVTLFGATLICIILVTKNAYPYISKLLETFLEVKRFGDAYPFVIANRNKKIGK